MNTMAIKSRLPVLMAEYPNGPLRFKQVAQATNIRPDTVSDIYYGRWKHLSQENLERLCEFFGCQPGDLLKWEPDEEPAAA